MLDTWIMVCNAGLEAEAAGRQFCLVHMSPALTKPTGPTTSLNTCELCGRKGTRRRVTIRNDTHGWNRETRGDWGTPSKDMLCVGCWNRVRVIVRKKLAADEIRRLGNQLYNEALKWRKEKSPQAAI
jgi:hypothetical protein